MNKELKFDHFKNINELLQHIDIWYKEDDIDYTRWFHLEDLKKVKDYITNLQQENKQLKELKYKFFDDSGDEESFTLEDYLEISNKLYDYEQENKQLKEQLENKIDLYEDTISYQLGFDKGKEYLQQRIDKAIEYIKDLYDVRFTDKDKRKLLEILGDKEYEFMD